ncbi:MAG: DNA methyltransferase [Desulfobaccales bacterium]
MPLSWNEIKTRAFDFSREWADEASEDAEAKSFLDAFFNVFGIPRKRVASFEKRVKKIDGKDGYIDLLWKGILLIEQKSRGKDLNRAYQQAKDYFPGIQDIDLPRYILVSDFARFRLYDLEEDTEHEFTLKNLYQNIKLFGFIAGYQTTSYKEQDPVNIKAAERMGRLHDKLKNIGYTGHELEVYLVRLLFCLFADDTSIFERRQFQDLIEQRTAADGQDLAQWLGHLFEVLNTHGDRRLKTLDEQLGAFPYVNGSLFAEYLHTAAFDRHMRDLLLECCALDWGGISPAIFGALFQSVMDPQQRRHLGAHYTTEKNILKLIGPLFLDELRAEFNRIKNQRKRLYEFQQRLASLKFLDPACGCGNFLVIAYRELRTLELDVLCALYPDAHKGSLDVAEFKILCDVDQFYGIEIEEFPAQIAQTALWLMDHQMNLQVSEEFGQYFSRLPLTKSATIVHANALQRDWREIVPAKELSYILGNPPFGGKKEQSAAQKADMERVFADVNGAGVLDYVAAWYRKAADYMLENPAIEAAFVSTNSITQGEQVGILWSDLFKRGVKIHFAHRTFQWSSEARGKAAVHCVIIGFGLHDIAEKWLFDYETQKSEPHAVRATNINPYLIDGPNVVLVNRREPICSVPEIREGSALIDDGHLLLSPKERDELLLAYPEGAIWVRPFVWGEGFINSERRYCLWLAGVSPESLRKAPSVVARVQAVSEFRRNSQREATKKLAALPALFGEIRQPKNEYLMMPKTSSERRTYTPIGFLSPDNIINNTSLFVDGAKPYHFGILSSAMHMAWVRAVCGRLKSDYRYSAGIVYNNFPWPQSPSGKQKQTIEAAAQAVLEARAKYPGSSLADLYDPLTMPPELVQAHRKLDAAVDAAYARRKFSGDSDRLAFLFELYQQLVSPLVAKKNLRRKSAR